MCRYCARLNGQRAMGAWCRLSRSRAVLGRTLQQEIQVPPQGEAESSTRKVRCADSTTGSSFAQR